MDRKKFLVRKWSAKQRWPSEKPSARSGMTPTGSTYSEVDGAGCDLQLARILTGRSAKCLDRTRLAGHFEKTQLDQKGIL
jgi:hypothetical protein